METPNDLAAFLIKAAATVVRLNLALGPDDEGFRQLAIGDMVDGIRLLDPWDGLRERLLAGDDPVAALSRAFSQQAEAYTEAAARATVALVDAAVRHLDTAGGVEAVAGFLDDLQHQQGQPAA